MYILSFYYQCYSPSTIPVLFRPPSPITHDGIEKKINMVKKKRGIVGGGSPAAVAVRKLKPGE